MRQRGHGRTGARGAGAPGRRALRRAAAPALAAIALAAGPPRAGAQLALGIQGIGVVTRADAPGGAVVTEARLIEPVAYGSMAWLGGRLAVHAMLDGEGWTMRGGALAPGDWGEGYYDRRHPHTLVHEVIATATDLAALPGAVHWSLAAGKGFAPFGTDDPMNRPALLFPVDHHWSQILERAVAVLGVRRGPVVVEVGTFDGDEPERWDEWPKWSRFGDSWSARGLVRPGDGLELQASLARVKSPEDRAGAGPTSNKVSVSARLERPVGSGAFYALAEWASNSEGVWVFHAVLVESEYRRGRWRPYARVEVADRPEDQRVFGDPFRSPRPPADNSLLGVTRWRTILAGLGIGLPEAVHGLRAEAIGEVAWAGVASREGVFDPAAFYGRTQLWTVNLGLRLAAGAGMHRMGRYGVAGGPMPGMAGGAGMSGMRGE